MLNTVVIKLELKYLSPTLKIHLNSELCPSSWGVKHFLLKSNVKYPTKFTLSSFAFMIKAYQNKLYYLYVFNFFIRYYKHGTCSIVLKDSV